MALAGKCYLSLTTPTVQNKNGVDVEVSEKELAKKWFYKGRKSVYGTYRDEDKELIKSDFEFEYQKDREMNVSRTKTQCNECREYFPKDAIYTTEKGWRCWECLPTEETVSRSCDACKHLPLNGDGCFLIVGKCRNFEKYEPREEADENE